MAALASRPGVSEKGLVRFDGVRFRLFQTPGMTSGRDPGVTLLAPERSGGLWVGLFSPTAVERAEEIAGEAWVIDLSDTSSLTGAGATITSRGVENLLKFWLSDKGYGPYLSRLRHERS